MSAGNRPTFSHGLPESSTKGCLIASPNNCGMPNNISPASSTFTSGNSVTSSCLLTPSSPSTDINTVVSAHMLTCLATNHRLANIVFRKMYKNSRPPPAYCSSSIKSPNHTPAVPTLLRSTHRQILYTTTNPTYHISQGSPCRPENANAGGQSASRRPRRHATRATNGIAPNTSRRESTPVGSRPRPAAAAPRVPKLEE